MFILGSLSSNVFIIDKSLIPATIDLTQRLNPSFAVTLELFSGNWATGRGGFSFRRRQFLGLSWKNLK